MKYYDIKGREHSAHAGQVLPVGTIIPEGRAWRTLAAPETVRAVLVEGNPYEDEDDYTALIPMTDEAWGLYQAEAAAKAEADRDAEAKAAQARAEAPAIRARIAEVTSGTGLLNGYRLTSMMSRTMAELESHIARLSSLPAATESADAGSGYGMHSND